MITGSAFAPAGIEKHWLGVALPRWRVWPQASAPRLDDLVDVLPKMKPHHGQPRTRRGITGPVIS